jgi:hypothetical protein
LDDEAVAPGFGKSAGRINLTTPGLSERQSPNAASPVNAPFCAEAWLTPANSIAVT